MPSVATANNLRSGAVIYLGNEGRWVENLAAAIIAESDAERAQLEDFAQRAVAANQVVGPYLMDVTLIAGAPTPISVRETIRAQRGPSIETASVETASTTNTSAEAAAERHTNS